MYIRRLQVAPFWEGRTGNRELTSCFSCGLIVTCVQMHRETADLHVCVCVCVCVCICVHRVCTPCTWHLGTPSVKKSSLGDEDYLAADSIAPHCRLMGRKLEALPS